MRIELIVGIGSLLWVSQAALANQNPFLETDGRLLIEAESESATGQWSLESDIADFAGNGYHVWTGSNHFGSPSNNTDNHIQYHFRIANAGNYQLRWRSRITVGDEATEHNDSWVRFPSGQNIVGEHPINGWTKAYMGQIDVWSWDAYTVDGKANLIRQYFEAGDHVMEISGRSNGHAIDRIALYQYETENFSAAQFNVLSESSRAQDELIAHEQLAGTCHDNSLSLGSIVEASVSAQGNLVPARLIASGNGQFSFLQFDLSDVPESTVSASLVLVRSSEGDSANVSIYTASHSDWDAGSSVDDLPYPDVKIGQSVLSAGTNALQYIELDLSQLARQNQTLILSVDSSAADVEFVADNPQSGPRLQIGGAHDFCSQFNNGGVEVNEPEQPSNTDDQQEEQTNENPSGEPGSDNVDTDNTDSTDITDTPEQPQTNTGENENSGETETPFTPVSINTPGNESTDTEEPVAVQTRSRSGGALSLWVLLLLAIPALRFRSAPAAIRGASD